MGWGSIDFVERERLLALYEAKDADAIRSEALRLEISPRTLARRCREHREYKRQYAVAEIRPRELSNQLYNQYVTTELDRAIVTSDWEEPHADPLMKDLVMRMAVRYDITDLIINGDFQAADQVGVSSHDPLVAEDHSLSYRSSVLDSIVSLEAMFKWFKRGWFTRGNHDDMINRVTRGQVDLGMFLEGRIEGVKYSNYAYMVGETDNGPYLICHPRQYANVSVGLGQRIYNCWATEDGRKAHVILGHTHQSQEGDSPDGLRGIYALGCMRHPFKAAYKNMNVGTFHQWSQGFGMLLNGRFHNFSLKRTDWLFYLGDMCPEALWHRTKHSFSS